MKACDESESAEGGEVVAIGAADLSNEAVKAKAAKSSGDLASLPAEQAAECLVSESVDQEIAAHEAADQGAVVESGAVEAAVGTFVLTVGTGKHVLQPWSH